MQYKACTPVIAPYQVGDNGSITYAPGKRVGKLMKVDVSPAFDNVKVYADDGVAEEVNLFKNASVTLGTNYIPSDCEPIMFGNTYDAEKRSAEYGENDNGKYVGFGSVYCKKIDGKDVYFMEWLHKVKFTLPNESRTTRNETVSFNTPSITGTAYKDENGKWRTVDNFDSLAEALNALFSKANMQTENAKTE